jgi:RHS repeat-associated protein
MARYAYDAVGVLTRGDLREQACWRFWRGAHVVNELRRSPAGDQALTWLPAQGQPAAEMISGEGGRLTLLAGAIGGSVLLEADSSVRPVAYAPHGHRPGENNAGGAITQPGFNGEMLDVASGCYLLGAGHHRPYSPTLGMFLAPDRASPFGAGGLNTLSYCAGDPINRADPTGHFWKWVVAAVGVVVGVAAVVGSFGAASGAVGAVLAGGFAALTKSGAAAIAGVTLGVAAIGTEVGAVAALSAGDAKAATILGWIGVGLAVAGSAPAIARAATKGAAKLASFSQRIAAIRTYGLSGRGAQNAGRSMARTRRNTVFASPDAPLPSAASSSAAPGHSRLVGYHGTSGANADRMLGNGASGIYLTDRYESAAYYARAADRGKPGVVLGMYADDAESVRALAAPKVNGKGIAEVINEGSMLRAQTVGPNAPPIDDFIGFWSSRVVTADSRVAAVRRMVPPDRMAQLDAIFGGMNI